ncbi:Transposon protein [Hordeum vulgare]|nr:Transposon protein [Hordeum vulgare]
MFIQIAARAAESDESYLMAANCAEKLAQDVETCLKHRSDPDTVADPKNITTTSSERNERPTKPKGMKVKEKTARGSNRFPDIVADPNNNSSTSSGQHEGFANPKEKNINSSTNSEQNKGLAKPKGMKFKEKTIEGASRPIGGLEKAKSKRKRKVDNPVAVQPHGTLMGHSEVFTNQMPAYLPQYNTILNPMAMHGQDQRLSTELQHYNSLMGHFGVPTNNVYTYSDQCNSAPDASLLQSLGMMTGHPALNALLQSSIGAPTASLQPSVGTMIGHPAPNVLVQPQIVMMIGHPASNAPLEPSAGMMIGQNQVFFQQQKPT